MNIRLLSWPSTEYKHMAKINAGPKHDIERICVYLDPLGQITPGSYKQSRIDHTLHHPLPERHTRMVKVSVFYRFSPTNITPKWSVCSEVHSDRDLGVRLNSTLVYCLTIYKLNNHLLYYYFYVWRSVALCTCMQEINQWPKMQFKAAADRAASLPFQIPIS